MQRGFRADCTTPSAVRLIASAGQTSAHVGCSQCMQTTGTVWTLSARLTYSRWIIDSPRCVSHSVHAWTQAWQPMQRSGSMKKYRWSGLAILDSYCCGSSTPAYAGAPSAFRTRQPHTLYCGILLMGSCAATVSWFALLAPAQ